MAEKEHPQQFDIVFKHLGDDHPDDAPCLAFGERVEVIGPLPTEGFHVARISHQPRS